MCLWWQDFLTESTRRIRRPSQPHSLLFQSRESLWNGATRTWCVKAGRTSHRSFTGVRTRHWAVTLAAIRNERYSRTGLSNCKREIADALGPGIVQDRPRPPTPTRTVALDGRRERDRRAVSGVSRPICSVLVETYCRLQPWRFCEFQFWRKETR